MGFSLMVLALLARLRVLVQQLLLDVVSVYNEISSLAQKQQSIKITQDGIEVFREYHPTMEKEIVVLECVWKTDKFVLVETKGNILCQDVSSDSVPTLGKRTRYKSIDAFLGDDESDYKNNVNDGEGSLSNAKRKRSESPLPFSDINSHAEQAQLPSVTQDGSENALEMSKITPVGNDSLMCSVNSPISNSHKPSSSTTKKVAFISIKTTAASPSSFPALSSGDDGEGKRHDDEDNSLYSLLSKEETRGNIF